MKRSSIVNLILVFSLCLASAKAQIDDSRLWTSVNIKHKFSRKTTMSFVQELRFDHDVTEVDQLFSDLGVEYEAFKNFKVALNYRFINKNKFTYYEKAHRMYADVSYKYKGKRFSYTLRERIQDEYAAIFSSENGKIPEWLSRTKLTITYNPDSPYKPFISTEAYYLIDNAKEKGEGFSRMRYSIGTDYEFNRMHSITIAGIYQSEFSPEFNSLVLALGYTYEF
jgi:hypothetical protein